MSNRVYSQEESSEMINNSLNDIHFVYGFEIKDGKIDPPKIEFDECVYDRLTAFDTQEAIDAQWTQYGIFQLIMGECNREDYALNPIGDETMFEPSKEFRHWLDMHYMWGPLMIMQAVLYGNYELKGNDDE